MKRRDSGFILVYVILLIMLAGTLTLALANGAHAMIRHTNRLHVQALDRNLHLSGVAWARHRAGNAPLRELTSGQTLELETGPLSPRPTQLILRHAPPLSDRSAAILIETQCRYGRQSLDRRRTLTLKVGGEQTRPPVYTDTIPPQKFTKVLELPVLAQ